MSSVRTPWPRHGRRSELIGLARTFVEDVRGTAGVREIALIGSLCTTKEFPKDADLLVTIDNEADLGPLARHSRRLQGQAQSIGHGADVFLLSPSGTYLGRVCHWKECRPGIRISCDALHCGKRAFLHDDLLTVRLSPGVATAPPLRLWPQLQVRGELPIDIINLLVKPLARTQDSPDPRAES
jgi:hypothetical protein